MWLADRADYESFRKAYMGFDYPDVQHRLSAGGGKVFSFYGNPGQLQEINPELVLETTRKDRVLHELLTRTSFQILYQQLSGIEEI